jgi:chromosome segregation ATPase
METKTAVEAVREEMEETQQSAMDELKAESEQLISSFDAALKKLQSEKDTVEEALAACRVKLEEVEDRNFDTQHQVKRACKIGATLQIRLYMVAAHWIRSVKHLRDGFSKKQSEALRKQKQMMLKEQERLRLDMNEISAKLRGRQDLIEKMRSALMNHKREMLMDHKVQSTVLQSDIAVIEKERAEIEKAHGNVVREMAELEGGLKAVENEMRDMTRQSAVRDGRVDPSFLRKKKAVDRRFELLLRKISEKREVITSTEQKLYVYDERKEEKENQLKGLETDLVSLLVQQQKRMLSILNTDNDD